MAAVLPVYSLFTICQFISSPESAIEFLQRNNLIRNNENCQKCVNVLQLSAFNQNVNVKYILRCRNRRCRARKSLLVGTFFSNIHYSIQTAVALLFYWASVTPIVVAEEHIQLSRPTIIDL